MQNRIPVLSSDGHPLVPCRPHRAKQLVQQGKAVSCWREGIYHLRLTRRTRAESTVPRQYEVNIAPGTKTSGYAVTLTYPNGHRITTALYEREHNARKISIKLEKRAKYRRGRRFRLRYRKPKGLRQWKPQGWLPPSQRHLLQQQERMLDALISLFPAGLIRISAAKFDPALMQDPDLKGKDYQHGTLYGWQLRAYIFHRENNRCAYCRRANTRLELDHIVPVSQGGPSRVGNLTAACRPCNRRKADQPLETFLADRPDLARRIRQRADSTSYRDATQMNVITPRIVAYAQATGINTYRADAATTSWNRKQFEVTKSHAYDAAMLGRGMNSIGILPERVCALRNSPKPRKQKANVDRPGTPVGKPYRNWQRLEPRSRSKKHVPGHAGKRKRYGQQSIATGDLVQIPRTKGDPVRGIAVVEPSAGRIRIRDTKPPLTASISKTKLLRRRTAVTCCYQPPSQTTRKPTAPKPHTANDPTSVLRRGKYPAHQPPLRRRSPERYTGRVAGL